MSFIKFQTNIPEMVTFRFDWPREYDSKFRTGEKVYSYGVSWKGEDAFLTATPVLNGHLQKLGFPLSGVTLQIVKIEEGGKKMWRILNERGDQLFPPLTEAPKMPSGGTGASMVGKDVSEGIDPAQNEKMRAWALKVAEDIKTLKAEVEGLKGVVLNEDNRAAYELHRDLAKAE